MVTARYEAVRGCDGRLAWGHGWGESQTILTSRGERLLLCKMKIRPCISNRYKLQYTLNQTRSTTMSERRSVRITINNDGTTKTEHYIDNSPRMEYDYCAFYMGNDRYAHFDGWGWLAVADLTEYDDDYRNAVNDLDAGDMDASQAADIINKGIKKGDLLIAKSHNPIEAMRLLCEKLDKKEYDHEHQQQQ